MVKLIDNDFRDRIDEFHIVDCRFPYEYEGGHIIGALNINSMEELDRQFFTKPRVADIRVAIIFHCEFSSHRAPRMYVPLNVVVQLLNSCVS